MSAEAVNNPLSVSSESKNARKKRTKAAEAAAQSQTESPSVNEEKTPDAAAANGDSSYFESPYVRELQKNLRNVTKKINAMSKLDAILAEHPNTSLEDLVATRKINADQKAQALKKPSLNAQVAQLEEQISQYKKVDQDYQSRMASQQSSLTSAHQSEIESLKQSLKQEHENELKNTLRQKLLTFSQFLRAAAAKRIVEEEADTDETKAFEGALLLVYGGDDKAVDAALNLIEGSNEQVVGVDGQVLPISFSHIKQASVSYGAFPGDESSAEILPEVQPGVQPEDTVPSSDPTIAHAGLTELGLNKQDAQPAELDAEAEPSTIAQGSTGDELANKSAGTSWDTAAATGASDDQLEESFEIIPRDAADTETSVEPAQPQSTNSWADQTGAPANATGQPEQPPVQPAANGSVATDSINGVPTAADDGFHEVERRGGRGGHRGERRGGRGRGGPRGGHRGSFRGRGEGRGRGRGGAGGAPQTQAAPQS